MTQSTVNIEFQSVSETVFDKLHSVIVMNAKTCFIHQDFFPGLNTAQTFLDIYTDEISGRGKGSHKSKTKKMRKTFPAGKLKSEKSFEKKSANLFLLKKKLFLI